MAQDDQNFTEKDFNETTTDEDSVFNEEFYQELNKKDRNYQGLDEESEDVEDMGTPNTSASLTDETDEDIE